MVTSQQQPNGQHPIWFPAKRYGWGWGLPVAWQGWVVMGVWMVILVGVTPFLAARSWPGFFIFLSVMSALLIAICYLRGEPLRWRWGDK
jgi:hypothetical protein